MSHTDNGVDFHSAANEDKAKFCCVEILGKELATPLTCEKTRRERLIMFPETRHERKK
jgi:hypothetical protein